MKNVVRWAALFDNHGNKAVESVVKVALDFCLKVFKPTIRIHGGDCFNFAALRKGANDEEKREKLSEDFDAGISFLEKFKPTHFLRGNHDERLYDMLQSDDGKLSDYAGSLTTQIDETLKGCKVFPYDKRSGVMQLGNHKVLHGYNTGLYAARHMAAAYGHSMMGHVHSDDVQSIPRWEGAVGHTSGCLCAIDQDYNRSHIATLRQSHGWLYGFLYPSGAVQVNHARMIDGKWILPTEFIEV